MWLQSDEHRKLDQLYNSFINDKLHIVPREFAICVSNYNSRLLRMESGRSLSSVLFQTLTKEDNETVFIPFFLVIIKKYLGHLKYWVHSLEEYWPELKFCGDLFAARFTFR